jgi:hypothetical protein
MNRMKGTRFACTSAVWRYPGMAGWHFLTVPKGTSAIIKERFGAKRRGWGSIPVMVTIGKTRWKTSIFPDRRAGAYLLPLKAEVRKRERIRDGQTVRFTFDILA